MRENRWKDRWKDVPVDLAEKTLLIVGFGRIGTRTAKRCLAMDMNVLIYDPYVPAATIKAAGCEPVSDLDAALARADVVCIHCPKTPETIGMFNAARFAKMKPSAYIVNTARGGIIDEYALKDALTGGKLAGAGIDVFDKEPPPADNPISKLPNTIVSAHMAGVTDRVDGPHGDRDREEHSQRARRHAEQGECGEQGGVWLGSRALLALASS